MRRRITKPAISKEKRCSRHDLVQNVIAKHKTSDIENSVNVDSSSNNISNNIIVNESLPAEDEISCNGENIIFENGDSIKENRRQSSELNIAKSDVARRKTVCKSDASIKLAYSRKLFYNTYSLSKPPERSDLKMIDMIYYNPFPKTNQNEDDPDDPTSEPTSTIADNTSTESVPVETISLAKRTPVSQENYSNSTLKMLVPQIRIGANGQIELDEQYTIAETNGTKRSLEDIVTSPLIYDDGNTSYGVCKKRSCSKSWSTSETLCFYKALSRVGADFSIMSSILKGRTRNDLKLKFKKEEKNNLSLVNKVLSNPQNFDLLKLEEELSRMKDNPPPRKSNKNRFYIPPFNAQKRAKKSKLVNVINFDVYDVPDYMEVTKKSHKKICTKDDNNRTIADYIKKRSASAKGKYNVTADGNNNKNQNCAGEDDKKMEEFYHSIPSTSKGKSSGAIMHIINIDSDSDSE